MGAVGDGTLEVGGNLIGGRRIFCRGSEISHERLSELIRVDSMHERKTKLNKPFDGFIALPGSFGTRGVF